MNKRIVRLHLFCSVKGGVGKSTLATAAAKLLVHLGRKPAFLDCDLSGTSIADGLRLCAPDVPTNRELADVLAEPTGRHLSVAETEEKRRDRKRRKSDDGPTKDFPYLPPYLNDALIYANRVRRRTDDWPKAPRTDALIWLHETNDGVLYLPSSSILEDVQGSMSWFLGKPYDFAYALMTTIDSLVENRPELTDLVLDLPPGLYGFPHEALMMAINIETNDRFAEGFPQWVDGPIQWDVNPFMVTSQDPNDFIPAMEYILRNQDELPSLLAVVNKRTQPLTDIQKNARKKLGPMLANSGIEATHLKEVGFYDALAKLFWDGDIAQKDIPEPLLDILRLRTK